MTVLAEFPRSRHNHDRYLRAILDLNGSLRFGSAATVLGRTSGAVVTSLGNGTTTAAARTADLPHRYLVGLAGFRLAQYLQLGYASGRLAVDQALFGERTHTWHPDDWHVFTLDDTTGRILGYLALVRNGDPAPQPVHAAGRRPFPVESAHRIDLLRAVAAPARMNTHEVLEIKRFVHARHLGDRDRRLRITLELLLTLTRALRIADPPTRAIIGDAEAHVALRHLLLMGMHVLVVTGTEPRLPEDDLMHPMYVTRTAVRPFYIAVPDAGELQRLGGVLEKAAAHPSMLHAVRLLAKETGGRLRSIPVAVPGERRGHGAA